MILKLTSNLKVSIENSHGINTVRAICHVISNINRSYRLQFVHLRYKCFEIMVIINTWSTFLYFQSKIIAGVGESLKSYITGMRHFQIDLR
jgi:hypothetical protein